MEFTVKTEELLRVLNIVKGTFGNKNFPALNNIYFDAEASGDVTVRASNGHETTTTKFTTPVKSAGIVLIDGFTISKIVGTFATGDVTIARKGSTFHVDVTHPTGELEIAGEDPLNFVNLADVTEQSSFMIPSVEFKEALQSVAFARAVNDSTAMLNGVAIIVDNGKTSLYASDRTRVAKFVFDTPSATDINIVVGAEVVKGLNAVNGNIAVRLADNGLLFETNDSSYQTTVMTTGYPPKVGNYFTLPTASSLVVDRNELLDVLTRVSILSKAGKDDPHADFEFRDSGELEITFTGTRGKIKSEKITTTHAGPSVSLKLSVDKILQSIKQVNKDRVELTFPQGTNNSIKAVNIFPEGSRDYGIFNMAVSS